MKWQAVARLVWEAVQMALSKIFSQHGRSLAWRAAAAFCAAVLVGLPLPPIIAQQQSDAVFKQEELEQILAPIALHPDSLVSQILMASTYPLEVVQAERWAKQNASLKADALTAALEKQDWDPSVKSLVNFPQVLTSSGYDPEPARQGSRVRQSQNHQGANRRRRGKDHQNRTREPASRLRSDL